LGCAPSLVRLQAWRWEPDWPRRQDQNTPVVPLLWMLWRVQFASVLSFVVSRSFALDALLQQLPGPRHA
jgi:hypothetical protein